MTPDEYNTARLASGELDAADITTLVKYWQTGHGLVADGKFGPKTSASLGPPTLSVDGEHWLDGSLHMMHSHESWYGREFLAGKPQAIVAHYTATAPGTGLNMARTRMQPYDKTLKPAISSWHITIEQDGSIIQMVPLNHVAWHAGSATAVPIKGIGVANYCSIGIELVSPDGKDFPSAQVTAACQVWRALVKRYDIKREHAMIAHSDIDPTRRSDPGPLWMGEIQFAVLNAAYA